MWILWKRLMILQRILSCEFSSGEVLICVIRNHSEHRTKPCAMHCGRQVLRTETGDRNWGQKGHSGCAGHPSTCVMRHKPAAPLTSTKPLAERILCPGLLPKQQSPGAGTSLWPQPAWGGVGAVKWSLSLLPGIAQHSVSGWLWSFLSSAGRTGKAEEHPQRFGSLSHCCPFKVVVIPLFLLTLSPPHIPLQVDTYTWSSQYLATPLLLQELKGVPLTSTL